MNAFTAFFRAIGEALGLVRERQALNNTPEMRKAAEAKVDAEITDTARDAVAKRDIEKIRKGTSE